MAIKSGNIDNIMSFCYNLKMTQSLEVRWMVEGVVIRFRKVLILAEVGQKTGRCNLT